MFKKYIYKKEKSNQPFVYTSRAWAERERDHDLWACVLGDIWRQLIKGWLTRGVLLVRNIMRNRFYLSHRAGSFNFNYPRAS